MTTAFMPVAESPTDHIADLLARLEAREDDHCCVPGCIHRPPPPHP